MSLPRPQVREHVRMKRLRLELTLDDVAFAMGTSVSTLSRFERGMLGTLPGNKGEFEYEACLDAVASERDAA